MTGTVKNWFKYFKDGSLSLEIKSRGGKPSLVNYDALR